MLCRRAGRVAGGGSTGRRYVRGLRRLDWFIPFQVNSFHPASPDGAPGNVAASVRRFRFQAGGARNREKERAFRVGCQVLNAPLERTGVAQRLGVDNVRDVRRERLAHLWRAGNRRGVLGGGFPLQGNAAANYGGGETARRGGVALSLMRPGDEPESKRRWPREMITAHPTP